MSYGPRGAKGSRRTYLYVEALRKFKDETAKINLDEAYKKALPMYAGRLEHTFVLLKEADGAEPVSGVNKEPLGTNKRKQLKVHEKSNISSGYKVWKS